MRLDDIMAGLDSQIVTLRRQARAAEKYRGLSEMIRTAEARVLFARWREAAEAAKAARAQASAAEEQVAKAQTLSGIAQNRQAAAAQSMAKVRDVLTDRRDDAHAQGNLLAQLTTKLEGVERQLKDLTRQHARLEEDQGEADRLTRDAAAAIERLERDHDSARTALAQKRRAAPPSPPRWNRPTAPRVRPRSPRRRPPPSRLGSRPNGAWPMRKSVPRPAGWRGLRVKSSGRQRPCARWKRRAM
jgi:chromosome segregation protein